MKKTINKMISLTLAFVMFCMILTSCGITGGIGDFIGKVKFITQVAEQMNKLEGYNAEYLLEAEMKYQGDNVNCKVSGEEVIFSEDSSEYKYYSSSQSEITVGDKLHKNAMKYGYQDGYMYLYVMGKSDYITAKSPIEKDEYIKFKEKYISESVEIEFLSDSRSFKLDKLENGFKKAVFSDISDEGLESYNQLLSGLDEIMSDAYVLDDVEVTLIADDGYNLVEQRFDFRFALSDEYSVNEVSFPSVKYTGKFSNHNEPKTDGVNLKGYSNADDLRVIYYLDHELDRLVDEENAKFDLEVKTSLGNTVATENYVGEFSNRGKFTFSYEVTSKANANADETKVSYEYDGDKIITTYPGKDPTSKKVNAENAVKTIKRFIDYGSFNYGRIRKYTVSPNGASIEIYTLDPSTDLLKAITQGAHATEHSVSERIVITLDLDNKISSYQYIYSGGFTIGYYRYSFSLKTNCDIEY